jgi:hypothetical protein
MWVSQLLFFFSFISFFFFFKYYLPLSDVLRKSIRIFFLSFPSWMTRLFVCLGFCPLHYYKLKKGRKTFNLLTADRNWLYRFIYFFFFSSFSSPSRPWLFERLIKNSVDFYVVSFSFRHYPSVVNTTPRTVKTSTSLLCRCVLVSTQVNMMKSVR